MGTYINSDYAQPQPQPQGGWCWECGRPGGYYNFIYTKDRNKMTALEMSSAGKLRWYYWTYYHWNMDAVNLSYSWFSLWISSALVVRLDCPMDCNIHHPLVCYFWTTSIGMNSFPDSCAHRTCYILYMLYPFGTNIQWQNIQWCSRFVGCHVETSPFCHHC